MAIAGGVLSFYAAGILVLLYLSIGLTQTNQALILASALSSVGTLALALATFVNVSQTNERLQIQQKDRERPLAVDELSQVIQPAISSLQNNLQKIRDSDTLGCTFEWVYIDSTTMYSPSKGPDSVRINSSLIAGRLYSEDPELYELLQKHESFVQEIAEHAHRLHNELELEINRLLEEEDLSEESSKAVTAAVLKKLEKWGEDSEMTDFWEQHHNHLIRYANEETDVPVDEIMSMEDDYWLHIEDTLERLLERKAVLKQDYGISDGDINTGTEDYRDVK